MSDETENTSGDQAKGEREHRFLFIDVWWWDALGGFFSVLGVLAALFGIYEYKQRVEASKASETLALIDVWETRGAREAYEKLSNEIASGFAQVPAADMTAAADDPALARVVRVGERAWPMSRLAEAGTITEAGVILTWEHEQASALGAAVMGEAAPVGAIRVRDTAGNDLPHDLMFAFAFHAFYPDGDWMLGE